MPQTTISQIPYPTLTDANNPPEHIQALAEWIDPYVQPQVQTYAPAWTQSGGTGLSIGNGTLTGEYVIIGKTCHYRILLTRGSTTNLGTASYLWSLPPVAPASGGGGGAAGCAIITVGGVPKQGAARLASSSVVGVLRPDDSGLGPSSFTWATGDTIAIAGSYITT